MLLFVLLSACTCAGNSIETAPIPTCAGTTCLRSDAAAGTLTLEHDGAARLQFPADWIAVGVVDAVDPGASYDPTFGDEGVTWRALTSVEGAEAGLRLAFEGGVEADVSIEPVGDAAVALRVQTDRPEVVRLRIRPRIAADEGLYGLGEWFDRPEHRGLVRASHLLADLTIESGYNEVHVPVPLIVGTDGWGIGVDDLHAMAFDMGATDPERLGIDVAAGDVRIELYTADAPIDVTRRYWATTGAPTLPAPWALGPLLWRDENIDQVEVMDDLDRMRSLDLATSGVWIDRPYATGVNTFDFNPSQFDDPTAMIAHAHALGMRMGLWHTPYVSADQAPELNAVAVAEGYFPPEVPIYFNNWSEPLDFTNPDAVAWWQDLVGRYRALGVEGFKLDYGEDVVVGLNGRRLAWSFHDGSDERTMHKGYSLAYHQTYAETLGEDGGFLLCRGGTWGGHVYASMIWPGDLDADLSRHGDVRDDGTFAVGGLPAAVSAALSLGPSGYPFFASDTGGYRHSPPDRETFLRWTEHTALSAAMQVGNSASTQPWEILTDPEDLDIYRRYARLHARLFPYLWTYAQELDGPEGRPIVRAFGLVEPALGAHPADEYFLGDVLLVAPVVDASTNARTFVAPTGAWRSWWDGAPLDAAPGEMVTVEAPIGRVPLWIRAGGIVPLLRPTIDTIAPATDPEVDSYANDPGVLWGRVAAGGDGRFTLWDGATLVSRDDGTTVTLEFTAGDVFVSGAAWELVGVDAPASVLADGATLDEGDGWTWEDGVLTVDSAATTVVVTR